MTDTLPVAPARVHSGAAVLAGGSAGQVGPAALTADEPGEGVGVSAGPAASLAEPHEARIRADRMAETTRIKYTAVTLQGRGDRQQTGDDRGYIPRGGREDEPVYLKSTTALLAAAGCCIAVGAGSPARAADQISENAAGLYSFRYVTRESGVTWVMTPCGEDRPRCVEVTKYESDDALLERPGWRGNAYWAVGSWSMVVDVPGVKTCDDGTRHTLPTTYSWNAVTNVGWRSFVDPGLCGDEGGIKNRKFQLTRIGPPPGAGVPAE